jgi:AbrB family looped-hinge helix DNA binding protein
MYFRTSKVTSDGQIIIPVEFQEKMKLSADDYVAFIYENNRLILRKLTTGEGQMTFDEHLLYRDIKIKNENHERIVKLFYGYAGSVTGNSRLYPDLISNLLNIDLSSAHVQTACLNGVLDGTEPPYNDVDLYIKFNNDVRVYVYGVIPNEPIRKVKDNEYVLIVLADNLNGQANRKPNKHVYLH